MDKTGRAAERMVKKGEGVEKTSYGIKSAQYITPETILKEINEKMRREKEGEVELCESLFQKARYEMPAATNERLNAIVHRQIQHIKHGKKEEPDPELTFKPNVT